MNPTFWNQLGEHAATIALQVGEEVALAFLSGFLSKKLGTPINLLQGPPTQPPATT